MKALAQQALSGRVVVCVCMDFMAPVLCVRSQDSLMSVSVRRVHVVSWQLDLRAEESRVLRQVKPLRCGEESRKSSALSRVVNRGRDFNAAWLVTRLSIPLL